MGGSPLYYAAKYGLPLDEVEEAELIKIKKHGRIENKRHTHNDKADIHV